MKFDYGLMLVQYSRTKNLPVMLHIGAILDCYAPSNCPKKSTLFQTNQTT